MMPLDDLRVLDMTQVLAGPFCTMSLADMGAEVTIVEDPHGGRRRLGGVLKGDDGAGFIALNRNKRSISINLRSDEGREIAHRLVAEADVFVENFRVGVTAKLGVDWPTLREINPRLVYASISGYGQNGPYVDLPGYDILIQAVSGIMSVTGEEDAGPIKSGLPITDLGAGMVCAQAILVALHARERTGRGQYIDTSLYDAALAMSVWESSQLWSTGEVPGPLGSAHRGSAPYQAVRTADSYLTIGVNNEKFWGLLCDVIDRPDLTDDERFSTNPQRLNNRVELVKIIEEALANDTTQYWCDRMVKAGIPVAPILDYGDSLASPQTEAREMVQTLQHPVEGEIKVLGIPAKLSDTPGSIRTAAPLLGAHTREILLGIGYDADEIDRMQSTGVIHAA